MTEERKAYKFLTIPASIVNDPDATEMIRAWISNDKLVCVLNVGIYQEYSTIEEECAWGIILADTARHVCKALQERYGIEELGAMERLRSAFLEETAYSKSKLSKEDS